jgi:quinol-cytochrome oxidoreductase complex cytochrome b subunit
VGKVSETANGKTRRWLAQLWADLKASTDPGVLGVARFLGLLYGPIDRKLPIDQAFRKMLKYRLASYVGWRHVFGGITYLFFIVLVVTGVLLSFYYRPSPQEAYPSIQYIVSEIPMGWLIRDLHVWSANFIVIALLAHMARVFFAAAYKPPRETNWLVGLFLLFLVLGFGATGYLLPWDQWAYWTVTEVIDTASRAPLIAFFAELLRGDVQISGASLSRFFALHVIILPWIGFALIVFHFMLVRRHGIAPPPDTEAADADGIPFFPDHLLRSLIVGTLVLAVTISAAALFPRPIGDPADPFQVPEEIVSSWIVVDVFLALIRYLGVWGLVLFALLGLILALLPLFDRKPERRMRRRPLAVALGLIFFGGFLIAWLAGRQLASVPPSADVRPGEPEEIVAPRPSPGEEPVPTPREADDIRPEVSDT